MLSLYILIIKVVNCYGSGVYLKCRKIVDKVIKNYVFLIIKRCKVNKKL